MVAPRNGANGNGGRSLGAMLATWVPIGVGAVGVFAAILNFFIQIHTNSADIDELKAEIARLHTDIGQARADSTRDHDQITTLELSLREIETQFCAADAKVALFHSYDLRFEAVFYEKLFGIPLPIANAVYPQVGHCAGAEK